MFIQGLPTPFQRKELLGTLLLKALVKIDYKLNVKNKYLSTTLLTNDKFKNSYKKGR